MISTFTKIGLALGASGRTLSSTEETSDPTCWLKAYGRGAGEMPLDWVCPDGLEKDGLLCYESCRSGFVNHGGVCSQICPSGFRDDGLYCAKQGSYIKWFGGCAAGFKKTAGVCNRICPSGMRDIGVSCEKADSYIVHP